MVGRAWLYGLAHLDELLLAFRQHLLLVGVALGVGILVCVPLGIWTARARVVSSLAINLFNSLRVIPSLAILFLAIPYFGLSYLSAVLALTVLALPPILVNTDAAFRSIDPAVRESALAMGMTRRQALWKVELPLAAPVILTGIRTASVEVIASATLAAFIGSGGLGIYITRGFALYDTAILLVGAVPVALLTLFSEGLFGGLQRALQPPGMELDRLGGNIVKRSFVRPFRIGILFLIMVQLLAAAACAGRTQAKTITVASKDFTEQFILGEMYAQLLEKAGFTVVRKLNLGGTPVAQEAITSGQIDLYPEYTGTGLLTVLKLPAGGDSQSVFDTVAKEYKDRWNLVWLDPAPMNNTQALAMTQEGSQAFGIKTISEMVAKAGELVMTGPPEFQEREDGLPGIMKAYGEFQLKEYKAVDPGLRYQALVSGQADVVVAFGTDGEINAFDLVVLKDDKNLFPPYQVAPVVRQEVLDKYPEVADLLNSLAPLLTDEVMRRLNNEVSGNGREPADVAKEFLTQSGLLG